MRIGLISLIQDTGNARELTQQNALASVLRARDHDIVSAERGILLDVEGMREAETIARADCDGLVVLVQGNEYPALAQQIALSAQTPILLVGQFERAYFESANSLQEGSITFDRLQWAEPVSLVAPIESWIEEHSKSVRQSGLQAAQNLYGQRFAEILQRTAVVDEGQWLEQFGVGVKSYELDAVHEYMDRVAEERVALLHDWLKMPDDGRRDGELQLYIALKDLCASEHIRFCSVPEMADGIPTALVRSLLNDITDAEGEKRSLVCAGDGDANAALTMQILHLITDAPVLSAELGKYDAKTDRFDLELTEGGFPRSLLPYLPDVTFARITRRARRFVCVMLRGSLARTRKGEHDYGDFTAHENRAAPDRAVVLPPGAAFYESVVKPYSRRAGKPFGCTAGGVRRFGHRTDYPAGLRPSPRNADSFCRQNDRASFTRIPSTERENLSL